MGCYFFLRLNNFNTLINNHIIQESRNSPSNDDNEEMIDKNDDGNNNVVIPTDSELQLESVYIPSTDKSMIDKMKRTNKKVVVLDVIINFIFQLTFSFIYIRIILIQ